jgi:hypothetical protein
MPWTDNMNIIPKTIYITFNNNMSIHMHIASPKEMSEEKKVKKKKK